MMVSGNGMRNNTNAEIRHQFGNVRAEYVGEELTDVLEYRASFLDGRHDAGEVVVEQDQIGRFLGHVGAGNAHGDADIGDFQGRCIVYAVTGDGDDLALLLKASTINIFCSAATRAKMISFRVECQLAVAPARSSAVGHR